jgi:hypothetical protein
MTRGDLVHIPQGVLLLGNKNKIESGDGYLRCQKPIRALFWEEDSKEPRWGYIYYRQKVWSVRMKEIYPITQEFENAS